MVSANVTGAGSYFASNALSSKKTQKESKQDSTFDIMLNNTNSKDEKVSFAKSEMKDENFENVKTEEKTQVELTNQNDTENEIKKTDTDFEKAIKELKNQVEKGKKSLKENEISVNVNNIVLNLQDVIAKKENAVKEKVADALEISTEELDTALEELNINVWDLEDIQNAKQLVMAIEKITDVSQVLVDNELLKNINELSEKITDIITTQIETFEDSNVVNEEVAFETEVFKIKENDKPDVDEFENSKEILDDNEAVDVKIKGEDLEQKLDNMKDSSKNEPNNSTSNDNKTNELHISKKVFNENINVDGILRDLSNAIVEKTDGIDGAKIVSQIIDQINVNVNSKMTSLEIQLYPEHLGKVVIEVSSKDGVLNAKIAAESENVKNAIEGQLTILKESLNNHGIKVESVEVTIAGHGFEENLERGNERNNDANQGKRTIRKDLLDEINGLDEIDEIAEEVKMETIGNTVSYKA